MEYSGYKSNPNSVYDKGGVQQRNQPNKFALCIVMKEFKQDEAILNTLFLETLKYQPANFEIVHNPTKHEAKERMIAMGNKVKANGNADDVFVFVYSGHAHINNDREFEMYMDDYQNGGLIDTDRLDSWLRAIRNTSKVFIMDTCHSGQLKPKELGGDGVAIFSACRGEGRASADSHLLHEIQRQSANLVYKNRPVDVPSLFYALGKRLSKKQKPYLSIGGLRGMVTLGPVEVVEENNSNCFDIITANQNEHLHQELQRVGLSLYSSKEWYNSRRMDLDKGIFHRACDDKGPAVWVAKCFVGPNWHHNFGQKMVLAGFVENGFSAPHQCRPVSSSASWLCILEVDGKPMQNQFMRVKRGYEKFGNWFGQNWGMVLGDTDGRSAFLKFWNNEHKCYFHPGQNKGYTVPPNPNLAIRDEIYFLPNQGFQVRGWN